MLLIFSEDPLFINASSENDCWTLSIIANVEL